MGSGGSTIKGSRHGIVQRQAVESNKSDEEKNENKLTVADLPNKDNCKLKQEPRVADLPDDDNGKLKQGSRVADLPNNDNGKLKQEPRVADLPNKDNGKLKQESDGTPTGGLSTNSPAMTISTNQTLLPQGLDVEINSFDLLIPHQSAHLPQTIPKRSPDGITNSGLSTNSSALNISTNQTSLPQGLGVDINSFPSLIAHQSAHLPQTIPKRSPGVITNSGPSSNSSALNISTNQTLLPLGLDAEMNSFDSLIAHQSAHLPQTIPNRSPHVMTNSFEIKSNPANGDTNVAVQEDDVNCNNDKGKILLDISTGAPPSNVSTLTVNTNKTALPQGLSVEGSLLKHVKVHQAMHIPQPTPKSSLHVTKNT